MRRLNLIAFAAVEPAGRSEAHCPVRHGAGRAFLSVVSGTVGEQIL
jgi:hypothetical protein